MLWASGLNQICIPAVYLFRKTNKQTNKKSDQQIKVEESVKLTCVLIDNKLSSDGHIKSELIILREVVWRGNLAHSKKVDGGQEIKTNSVQMAVFTTFQPLLSLATLWCNYKYKETRNTK